MRDESAKSFERFTLFRDLGPKRSLSAVARTLTLGGHRISRQRLAEQAARYRWQERAAAYDLYTHKQLALAVAGERRAARKRQIQLSVGMQRIAMVGLREMLDKIAAGIELHLSPSEIANLAAAGQQLEREGLGDCRDYNVQPEIQVILDGKPVRQMMPLEDDEPPRKPN